MHTDKIISSQSVSHWQNNNDKQTENNKHSKVHSLSRSPHTNSSLPPLSMNVETPFHSLQAHLVHTSAQQNPFPLTLDLFWFKPPSPPPPPLQHTHKSLVFPHTRNVVSTKEKKKKAYTGCCDHVWWYQKNTTCGTECHVRNILTGKLPTQSLRTPSSAYISFLCHRKYTSQKISGHNCIKQITQMALFPEKSDNICHPVTSPHVLHYSVKSTFHLTDQSDPGKPISNVLVFPHSGQFTFCDIFTPTTSLYTQNSIKKPVVAQMSVARLLPAA